MKPFGIYTLANDVVFDQLVALLNSIETNVSASIPICIIPFDDRIEAVKREVESRKNVTLFENQSSIERWENFARSFVESHPEVTKVEHPRWYKGSLHRKFAAFDGEFEKFVFFDGDSLAMKPVEDIWEKLENYDFVFDDWEHAKPPENAALNISLIQDSGFLNEPEIRSKLHCSSFWGSKAGIFGKDELAALEANFTHGNEAAWVNVQGWWDDAFLFNYMTLRCDRPLYNFTLSPHGQDRTGNCANADPFIDIDNVLYNQQGEKPIHRIHYMGYSSGDFKRLSQGEDVDIPFKEVFLHYRFLMHPEQKPTHLKPPSGLKKTKRIFKKILNKVKA